MDIGTQEVQIYRCKDFAPNTNVYLVDTPGFDDTHRKDTDILKEIATWLTTTYKEDIRLSGILYLHRISDNRMGGVAHRNLIMFRKLCGPEGVKNVIFLTTFWEKVDLAVGDNRENTLKTTNEYWGYFTEKGAQVQRHWNTDESAMAAIRNFVPLDETEPPEEISLAIQTEMVDSHKDLDQTSAGQELNSVLQKEREKMLNEFNERAREIQQEKDQEMRDLLREDQERQARDLQRRDAEIQELKISMERMHEKKLQQMEERFLEQQNESRKHREEIEQLIRQHRESVQSNRVVEKLTQEIRDLKTSNTEFRDLYKTLNQGLDNVNSPVGDEEGNEEDDEEDDEEEEGDEESNEESDEEDDEDEESDEESDDEDDEDGASTTIGQTSGHVGYQLTLSSLPAINVARLLGKRRQNFQRNW